MERTALMRLVAVGGLALALLATDCRRGPWGYDATVYLVAQTDPDSEYELDKNNAYFIVKGDQPSIEQKKLTRALAHAMKRRGFNVTEKMDDANFLVGLFVKSKLYETKTTSVEAMPSYVWGTDSNGNTAWGWATTYQPVERTTSSLNYQVMIDFVRPYRAEDGSIKVEHFWNGYVDVPVEAFDANPECVLERILIHFGMPDRKETQYWFVPDRTAANPNQEGWRYCYDPNY